MEFERMEEEIGPVRHALAVPALDARGYAAMQRALVDGVPGTRPGRRRRFAALAAGIALGGLGGYLVAAWEVSAELWVASVPQGWMWSLDGLGVVLAATGLVLATILLLALLLAARQRRALRALHAAGGEVFGAHDLLLGERGILWRNASRTLAVPWSRVTGAVRRGGYLFLVADRVSAFWLPEPLLAAHPDRAAVERLLDHRA